MPTNSKSATGGGEGGGGGTSFVSVKRTTAWHELKVKEYSKFKGQGIGRCTAAATFSVGEHSWCIKYFLNGYNRENANCISFAVRHDCPLENGDTVKAELTFSLIGHDGETVSSHEAMATFTGGRRSYVTHWYFEDLESSYLKDDSFRVRCDVTVIEEICTDLHRHLGDLLATGVGGDVTFEVGEETFVAHKNVLATRSSVFMAEFFGSAMKEKAATRVRIDDIEATVFKAMLHFIYTDSFPEIDEGDKIVMAQHLLVAADRYNLERLKLICENTLLACIDTNIAPTTLVLAEQHGCNILKEACFKFLKNPDNFKAMTDEDSQHLVTSCPSLFNELLAKRPLGPL
ncbi:hypothetical protein ACP70R_007683 [Stipagrostis hirtigluma subsp. patula]